jgi:hypothetical protein
VSDFSLWFTAGLEHIADLNGYDHILYLLVLCGIYELRDAKRILILVTAFTAGHSLTLALSALNVVRVNAAWIEFFIPLTILATAFFNLAKPDITSETPFGPRYAAALVFGFIHGLGFSFLLKAMLGPEENILIPLFAFNLGIEIGQVLIVAVVLLFSLLLTSVFGMARKTWNFFISSAVFGIAFIMAAERFAAIFE